MKFYSPDYTLCKEDRITNIFNQIFQWLTSDAFNTCVGLYGGKIRHTCLEDALEDAESFVLEHFDFRAGRERFHVGEDNLALAHRELIFECATKLGMAGPDVIQCRYSEYDNIFILGGANLSNLHRTEKAYKVATSIPTSKPHSTITALTCFRPLQEKEFPFVRTYSSGATEYEAIADAVASVFGCSEYRDISSLNENPNLSYCIRKYTKQYNGYHLSCFSAPSSEPDKRRANSLDTYRFFFETNPPKAGDKCLLITSPQYTGYQFLAFFPLALEFNIDLDIVGDGDGLAGALATSQTPTRYLQEMKGTVDTAYKLFQKYKHLYKQF